MRLLVPKCIEFRGSPIALLTALKFLPTHVRRVFVTSERERHDGAPETCSCEMAIRKDPLHFVCDSRAGKNFKQNFPRKVLYADIFARGQIFRR